MDLTREILSDIKIEKDFLSSLSCDFLVSFAEDNPDIFKSRKTFFPNYGLKKDLGEYFSCQFSRDCFSDIFKEHLDITFNGLPVKEIQLNRYEAGDFIPPHKDMQRSIHTIIVPLQDDCENKLVIGDPECYYNGTSVEESDKEGKTKSFPDIKGNGYRFDGVHLVHWVPPVKSKRYSATFLYAI